MAIVFHRQGDAHFGDAGRQSDVFAGGEGHGIVEKAVNHGGQHGLVGVRHKPHRTFVGIDGDAARLGARREDVARQPQHAADIHRHAAKVIAAGRDLGEVHDLVDDLEQVVAALMHQAGIFADLCRGQIVGQGRHQIGKTQNGVERRLEFMAHGAQQGGLGAVHAGAGLVQPLGQIGEIGALLFRLGAAVGQGMLLFGQGGFGPHLVGDVGEHHDAAAVMSGAVAHQIGFAGIGAQGDGARGRTMCLQPALQPFFRRFVQNHAAAIGDLGADFGKGSADQFVQLLHAAQAGIEFIGQDQPVIGVIKGKGFGGKRDRFLQPRQLGARRRHVAPQQHGVAVFAAPGLDLHHPVIAQGHVARREFVVPQLVEPLGDKGFGTARQGAGRDFAAFDFQANELAIAATDQRLARRKGAEQKIEMGIGIEQPAIAVENRDSGPQRVQRAQQRGRIYLVLQSVLLQRSGHGHLLCSVP